MLLKPLVLQHFRKKSHAVAAVRWSLNQRRCSHSNTFFVKPFKTNEILILFVSESRFAYNKNCGKSTLSLLGPPFVYNGATLASLISSATAPFDRQLFRSPS